MSIAEEIKDRLDIVDVVSGYVPLRKAGRVYKALCPFHQEKTPSFVVFPESGTWRCFGACGTGGDLFSFVMKRENLDFREALELLAPKAGVSLSPPDQATSERNQYLDKLREINQTAALFFHSQLQSSTAGAIARDYLQRRGLDGDTIDKFQMGYAPDSWDSLLNYLRQRGYTQEDILAAGLIIEKEYEEGGRVSHYDRFRGRVIVPIRDIRGQVVGFGARALTGDQQPKYLNTPQTPLFDKSSILFGLDAARQAIRANGKAIIVEGYMDVLACHQFGEANVVASMGTALTEEQLKQLRRYTDTIVLALDADTAGQAATLRGITQARESLDREWMPSLDPRGIVRFEARLAADLRIMTLPEGKDPDDVMRSDPDAPGVAWRALVDAALPIVDFYFDLVRQTEDLTSAQGKSAAVDQLAPLILEVSDAIQRAHYAQQLARLVQTDERTIERELVRRASPQRAKRQPLPVEEPPPLDDDPEWQAMATTPPRKSKPLGNGHAVHLLALLVLQPAIFPHLQSELVELGVGSLDEDDFNRAEERAVCAALLAGQLDDVDDWRGYDPDLVQHLEQLRAYGQRWPALSQQQLLKDLVDTVLRLRIDNLETRTRMLPTLVQDAESEGNDEDAMAYRLMQGELSRHRRSLEQTLNIRTYAGRRRMAPSL
ncbi:MAG: DNA primase [Caldilineales bacterium]